MMNTIFFIKEINIFNMGFLKTLFTGKRDELSAEEMKQYEELHKNDGEDYQLVEDESHINTSKLNLEDILKYLETLNSSQLIKVKNKIAQVEESIESGVSNNYSSNSEDLDKNEIFDENSEDLNFKDEFSTNDKSQIYDDDSDFEVVDGDSIYSSENDGSNDDNAGNDVTIKENSSKALGSNKDDDFVEIDDVSVSNLKSKDEYSTQQSSSYDDPALFSVIHDELMEIFEDGQVILLKEEFSFPSLGVRDTLAFGVFNNSLSQLSDQTHWFIQRLKQFSRLKECKMLLSEENEKDLILEVNEKYAILICFKTSNLVKEEFVFNRKWD